MLGKSFSKRVAIVLVAFFLLAEIGIVLEIFLMLSYLCAQIRCVYILYNVYTSVYTFYIVVKIEF